MALATIVGIGGAVASAAPKLVKIGKQLGQMLVVEKETKEVIKYEGKFDEFEESMKIKKGECPEKNWSKYVTKWSTLNEVPGDIRDDIINDMECCNKVMTVTHQFTFTEGSGQPCTGRFAAIKDEDNNNMIHFAIWLYKCNYKLKSNKIIREKKKNVWKLEWGNTQVIEHEPANLTKEEITALNSYFFNKAIDKFYKQAPKELLPDAPQKKQKKKSLKNKQKHKKPKKKASNVAFEVGQQILCTDTRYKDSTKKYKANIIKVQTEKVFVVFEGYAESQGDWIRKDEWSKRITTKSGFHLGKQILCMDANDKKWYRARIKAIQPNRVLVGFTNSKWTDPKYDQWVIDNDYNIRIRSKNKKCLGKCGFFGTEQTNGYCSKCYAKNIYG